MAVSMLHVGFLGTEAPLYMDIFVSVMALLPILIGIVIWFAVSEHYMLHHTIQQLIFWTILTLLGYIEYHLYFDEVMQSYIQEGSLGYETVFFFLLFHSFVVMAVMVVWFLTIHYAKADRKRRALPGLYSKSHKRMGKIAVWSIFLLSFSSMILYWMLFVA